MAPSTGSPDLEFAEAAELWNLERLYTDLGSAKGKGLTPVEKQYLRGLLCGYSPNEIAERCHVASDTVRNYLSKGLYRYIEEFLMRHAEQQARVKDWSRVAILMERAGYRLNSPLKLDVPKPADHGSVTESSQTAPADSKSNRYSWDGKPNLEAFYGRTQELAMLKQWILKDRCRLVALLGIGGVGKTALAAKLADDVQDQFDYIVWRSLHNAPMLTDLLADILSVLLGRSEAAEQNASVDGQLLKLMECLQRHRCLLVLEDVQAILSEGKFAGSYQAGYEDYDDLFRRMGEVAHQSCVLLTSWDKLATVAVMEGETSPVRSHVVKGLGTDAKLLLAERELADESAWEELIYPYRGNPLALKVVATTIHELFGGSVTEFLDQNTLFLGDFSYLLHQQFQRLSELEKEIICWLGHTDQPATLSELRQGIQADAPWSELLQALESLGRRSMIETVKQDNNTCFTLQPTIRKYVRSQGV
ncbi:MAG: NB-ARC domain-containing protein [Thainema sp.]